MLMTSNDYRETLRAYSPRVFVDGDRVEMVADEPRLAPGSNAIGVTSGYAPGSAVAHRALAPRSRGGERVNRFPGSNRTRDDLLAKLEYTRLVCHETGCVQSVAPSAKTRS